MPKRYELLSSARADLREIMDYIARDNPAPARKLKAAMMVACAKLGDYPQMGQEREDLTSRPVRFWPVHPNYMIIYDPATNPVHVVRIYNNARHMTGILPE